MKAKTAIVLGAFLVGIGLTAIGQLAVGLAILFLVAIVVGLGQVLSQQRARSESLEEQLSPDSKTRLRPIKRLHNEIEELVSRNQDSAAIKVIGVEALQESREMLDKCARLLKLRREIQKGLRGEHGAEKDAAELELELATAPIEERTSLSSALEARRLEGSHYNELELAMTQIDGDLKQAEAALSELKARLTLSATKRDEITGQNDLGDVVSRLKSLSMSFDEAEELLKERVS